MYFSIKQFLFLRRDLPDYNVGGLSAQACHASVAAIHKFKDHPDTLKYLENTANLTTIIYQVVEKDIDKIINSLSDLGIDYYVWIETDRSNLEMVTCIGTRPVETENFPEFDKFRKNFKLF